MFDATSLSDFIAADRYAQRQSPGYQPVPGDLCVVVLKDEIGAGDLDGQRALGQIATVSGDTCVVTLLADQVSKTFPIRAIEVLKETTYDQIWQRVATAVASADHAPKEAVENFKRLLTDHHFVPGGRVLHGAGTDNETTLVNCFVFPYPHDSIVGIMDTNYKMAETMRRGGGVGINLSSLRPKNSPVVKVNGRSSGAVKWGQLFSETTGLISQGGSRRGALMLVLEVWHPDVIDFINAKQIHGVLTNANISVGISDDFMRAVEQEFDWPLVFPDTTVPDYDTRWQGDLKAWRAAGLPVIEYGRVSAVSLWDQIATAAQQSAEPGIIFLDRMRATANTSYYPEGQIIGVNPCFPHNALLHTTDRGIVAAGSLLGTACEVAVDWMYSEPTAASKTGVFPTGEKEVFELQTLEGFTLQVTENHRIMLVSGEYVPLSDIQIGDKVAVLSPRGGAFGPEGTAKQGRLLAWAQVAQAGYITVQEPGLVDVLQDTLPVLDTEPIEGGGFRLLLDLEECNYFIVDPVRLGKTSQQFQVDYLRHLLYACGQVTLQAGRAGLRFVLPSAELARMVQLLFLNFGIFSTRHNQTVTLTDPFVQLFARNIGALTHRVQTLLLEQRGGVNVDAFAAHVSTKHSVGVLPVFDITVEPTHMIAINGIVTHNCGEQPLSAWGACNLGAINLSKFVEAGRVVWEKLGQYVEWAVRFLDNVITYSHYPLLEQKAQQELERRIGLGIMGYADMLIQLGLTYGTQAALEFTTGLFKFIKEVAYRASIELAKLRGPFLAFGSEYLERPFIRQLPQELQTDIAAFGIRNSTLLTIAPTGSTATMADTSTGIEPFFSLAGWQRKSRLGTHTEYPRIVQEYYALHGGPELPHYFVDAMHITPEAHILTVAAAQAHIDAAVSKTNNYPRGTDVESVQWGYLLAFDHGLKGVTVYVDGSRQEQVLNVIEPDPVPEPQTTTQLPSYDTILEGTTVRIRTGFGTLYTTLNNQAGKPFEVFLHVGKAGTETQANAEALGRLLSSLLQQSRDPLASLLEAARQLDGIGGSAPVGLGQNRIVSLPDAVAKAILKLLNGAGTDTPEVIPTADICPECHSATLLHEAGCSHCTLCGYSKC